MKIAIVVRDDLAAWQKINVTAFLSSGLAAQHSEALGQPYVDHESREYNPMFAYPVHVFAAAGAELAKYWRRAISREVTMSAYIEEMFVTGNDNDNRSAFAEKLGDGETLVGIALAADGKIIDKVLKGAKRHA